MRDLTNETRTWLSVTKSELDVSIPDHSSTPTDSTGRPSQLWALHRKEVVESWHPTRAIRHS